MTASSDVLARSVASFVDSKAEWSTFSLGNVLTALWPPVDAEHVVAALWDLVEDGRLTYGSDAHFVVLPVPSRLLAAV